MDWRRVCITAQLFAAARHCPISMHEPTLMMYKPHGQRLFMPSKLSILPNFNSTGTWYVRNSALDGGPPVYFPPVDNPTELRETLDIAWETNRKCLGPDDWRPVYLKSIDDAIALRKKT